MVATSVKHQREEFGCPLPTPESQASSHAYARRNNYSRPASRIKPTMSPSPLAGLPQSEMAPRWIDVARLKDKPLQFSREQTGSCCETIHQAGLSTTRILPRQASFAPMRTAPGNVISQTKRQAGVDCHVACGPSLL